MRPLTSSCHRRRDGAGVRLHQRLPRHRQRRRDVDLDARAAAAGRRRARGDPELRRRVPLARRSRRRSPRASSTPDAITPPIVFAGLIGAIAWNLVTWYFGLPSSSSHALIGGVVGATLVADGHRRGQRSTACSARSSIPALHRADARVRRRRDRRSCSSTGSSARLRPGRSTRGFRSARSLSGGAARARPRHQRRAEDDGRDHARADRQRRHLGANVRRRRSGSSSRPPRRSRSAPTPAAGGSSARWAPGSSRWTPAQGFTAQGAGAAVILAASHVGFPLSTTHVISGGVIGAGAAQARSRPSAGASPATSSSPGS